MAASLKEAKPCFKNKCEKPKTVRYSGRFVKESFSDKEQFQPGEDFTKSWTLRNDGQTSWASDTVFMQTNGDNLEAMPLSLMGEVAANEEHVWTVSMKAPTNPGRYTAYFRMCTGANIRFGHKVWCDILVVEPQPEPVAVVKPDVVSPLEQQQPVAFYPVIEDNVAPADKELSESVVSQLNSLAVSGIKTPKQLYFDDVYQETNMEMKQQLSALFELGFVDFRINKTLLVKHKNIETVAGMLIEGGLDESSFNQVYKEE